MSAPSAVDARARTASLFEGIGARCIRSVRGRSDCGVSATWWRYPSFELVTEELPCVLLCHVASGRSTVTRRWSARSMRRVCAAGSVTVVPHDARIEWSVEGPSVACVLSIDPRVLRTVAEEDLGEPGRWRIGDVFGVADAWLASYFRILALEGEEGGGEAEVGADATFIAQTQHLLLRHLVRHHACTERRDASSGQRGARVNPLSPKLVERVTAYVEAHLADPLHLEVLAALVHMSVEHFVRSFRAATGTTPHQFVLARRLERASALLREEECPIPLVAARCGFRNANHFSATFRAHFGIKPSAARRGA